MRFCEVCKKQIETQRAEAMPETRLCRDHGEAIREFGGEFTQSVSQERTSKQGSLKLNYGGIEAHSKRNRAAIEQLKDEYERQQFEE